MARKSRWAIEVEYLLLAGFTALVNLVPYPLAMRLARGLGWLLTEVVGFKRERTLSRIRQVFPGIKSAEARRIARRSLANVLESAVEMMRSPRLDLAWMDRYVKDGRHYQQMLKALVDEGRGVVIMVPHSGNWYMAAWAMAKYGQKLFALAAQQRNPKLDAWMKRRYGTIDVLYRGSRETLVEIKRRLRGGEAFAILPDLRAPGPDVEVDFLNGKANVSRAGALFAVRNQSPIVVAVMRREGGRHVFDYLGTLRPDASAANAKAEAARLTAEAMRMISARLLEHPGDWFWYNKRWVLDPVQR